MILINLIFISYCIFNQRDNIMVLFTSSVGSLFHFIFIFMKVFSVYTQDFIMMNKDYIVFAPHSFHFFFSDCFCFVLLLPGQKTFLDRYYFHRRVCVCLCVCLWVFISIISKSYWPILMTLGRMMYNDERQVPFEDELNRFIRTEVTENPYL